MKAFSIRLPDDVADKLYEIAKLECRSLNQQIEYAMRLYLAAYAEHEPMRLRLDWETDRRGGEPRY